MNKQQSSTITAITIIVAVVATISLAVLKLFGVFSPSWWWVFSPIWGVIALSLLAIGFLGICLMILSYIAKYRK